MNVADFTEWIAGKVNCECKKYKRHKNLVFKMPPYGSTFTLKFKKSNHVSNLDRS